MGLSRLAKFQRKNLFDLDYTKFDNVVIFGVNEMMPELEKLFNQASLDREALNTSESFSVIACRFPLPNRKPDQVIGSGIDSVWVYQYQNTGKDVSQ